MYKLHDYYTRLTLNTELTTMCGALIAHVSTVIIPITQVSTWDADVGALAFSVTRLTSPLS